MGNEWKELPFTEAVFINPKVILKKGQQYPFVDMKSVEPSWRDVSESELRDFSGGGARFEPYDTLMARITPCLENGKIARYVPSSRNEGAAFGSTEFIVIRGRDGVTDNSFAYYLTKCQEFRKFAISQMTGSSGRQRVPAEALSGFSVPVPSLPEQCAIAHILGTLDDKIELNKRMNETLEAMARAIFKSWFVDFDPVRAKAEGRDTWLPKAIADLFPDSFEDSKLGKIPKGWTSRSLYDSAKFINGAAYRDFHFTEEEGALPIIKIAELKSGITGQTKFTRTELNNKYRIDSGEILLSWSGNPDTSIDTFVWTGGPAWLNQHIFRVLPHAENEKYFAFYLLRHLRPVFAEIARDKQTTGLGHFTAGDMKRMVVVLPPEKILNSFNTFIAPIFQRWYRSLFESNALAGLRDTLLPKLISGELRVPDAEKIMENV